MTPEQIAQIDAIKKEIVDASIALLALQKEHDLPYEDSLESTYKQLQESEFNIAVCGAASQGKSTFINALMGRELLPSNEHPTTSQLFKINNAEKESFFFVFTDGTKKAFSSPEEMYKYGTALSDERTVDGKILDYIEINVSLKFIPPNVHIWDTPGLNVTHFSHSEITARCISNCNAVIFLSAPKAPFDENELKFLDSVYKYTGNILFVQSRTDEYGKEACLEKAKRNIEILQTRFGKMLEEKYGAKPVFNIFPVSSVNLLKSASTAEPEMKTLLFKRSHFEEVQKQLSALIFKTVGYTASWATCYAYQKCHTRMFEAVEETRKLLSQVSNDDKLRLQKEKKAKQDEFNLKWGENGYLYKELVGDISRIINTGMKAAHELFSSTGTTQREIINQINKLPDDGDVLQEYADSINETIPEMIANDWRNITEDVKNAISHIFIKFQVDFSDNCNSKNISTDYVEGIDFTVCKMSNFEKVRNLASGNFAGIAAGGALAKAIAVSGAFLAPLTGGISVAIAGILAPVAAIATPIWASKAAYDIGKKYHGKNQKAELQKAVNSYFTSIQKTFTGTKVSQLSQVDEFFENLKIKTTQTCKDIIQREKDNLKKEYEELEKGASLGIQETADALKAKESIAKTLLGEKNKMLAIIKRLNELAKNFGY